MPALRELWRLCFDADSQFLDLFFNKGLRLCRTYVLEISSALVSALSVFPIRHHGLYGGYVYGVCTHPDYRGRNYARTLLSETEKNGFGQGLSFFILRPASHSLFEYYSRQGYSNTITRFTSILSLPSIPGIIKYKRLTPERLFYLRSLHHHQNELFEWSIDECGYILEYTDYCHGQAIEINDGDAYFIAVPNSEQDSSAMILCEEAGGKDLDELLSGIKTLFPDAISTQLHLPGAGEKEPFLLAKTKGGISISDTALLSFTME